MVGVVASEAFQLLERLEVEDLFCEPETVLGNKYRKEKKGELTCGGSIDYAPSVSILFSNSDTS